ncbi:phosphatidylserine/phosphatidylglycerophosphate/cardiolipin synthase family protein [Cryptosporangium phraense]|uniref:Phosphatidylserine/phosphatidylglycerophosphate/ cardiolipin synthase family protein n=1 Tax=Cryptosporangium phraense TaxID=2593070 RepID=A0A545AIS2_9ACTN|nr:phosphatidylserine/phosphatidylglycerophosphate/cardiolipin synthase family protein [Cryptosporangium phraense]
MSDVGDVGALAARFFPAASDACPTFVEDSGWQPIVDGVDYFRELTELLDRVGPGDGLYIASYSADPDLDLTGRNERPFTDILAEKAADGADVRVVLSAAEYSGGVPWLPFGPFRANVVAARAMRDWRPTTRDVAEPPLLKNVLLDWSGPVLGSNHQKLVVFCLGGVVTAFVGGLDLLPSRWDASPHDRLRLRQYRWGWHDAAARLTGPAAERVHEVFRSRWENAAKLPPRFIAKVIPRRYFTFPRGGITVINPPDAPPTVPPIAAQPPQPTTGVALRVLRSYAPWRVYRRMGWRRLRTPVVVRTGTHEVYDTLITAIRAARRYIYLEDQYFHESPGGNRHFELFGELRAAAERGVKVILVGSGRRDPADGGDSTVRPVITGDLRRHVIRKLPPAARLNVVMYRVRDLTVHTKLMLIDDVFASIGSANFFSRSMVGTDSELTCAMVTTGSAVTDLRVRLWAEHLRTPVVPELADLDTALGIWRREWLAPGQAPDTWRRAGAPEGFAPTEQVLLAARYSRWARR